jgi:hypothetical protein
VIDITSCISYIVFTKVFPEWEQWLQKCINVEGDYVD